MASYNLVLDTKFKPFSFDELIKTPLMETQAHQAIEEEYGNLSTKASVWEEMADEQSDPYAYRLYKTYADDLNNKANQLLEQGLDISSRKSMLDMKSRYSKEITPIENAYKRREELAAEQRKAMMSNPTMMYQRYARNMSLDDFIRNPSADYGASYSGALLTQQVSQAASNIAKEISTPDGRRKIRKLLTENGRWLPYQYEAVLQKGFTREDVDKAIRGDEDANPILTNIVNEVLDSSGITGWDNQETKDRARYFANQGLYSAIGTTEFSNITDTYGQNLALQNAKEGNKNRSRNKGLTFDPGKGRFPISSYDMSINTSSKGKKDDDIRSWFGTKTEVSNPLPFVGDFVRSITKSFGLNDVTSNNPYAFETTRQVPVGNNKVGFNKEINNITFFNKEGDLLSREEYNEQLKGLNKKQIKGYVDYDDAINKLSNYLGIPKDKIPKTYKEIEQAITRVENGTGAGVVKVLNLPLSDEDTLAALNRVITYTNSDGKLTAKEITGYNDDGTYKLGNRVKVKDLVDDEGKLKNKGFFTVSDVGGSTHIIFNTNGKSYEIPLSDLGSIAENANVNVQEILNTQYNIRDLGTIYGENWYEQVLSLSPEEIGDNKELRDLYDTARLYEATLKNSGAGQVSSIVNALLSNYKGENYKVSSQTGEYAPYTINLDE